MANNNHENLSCAYCPKSGTAITPGIENPELLNEMAQTACATCTKGNTKPCGERRIIPFSWKPIESPHRK